MAVLRVLSQRSICSTLCQSRVFQGIGRQIHRKCFSMHDSARSACVSNVQLRRWRLPSDDGPTTKACPKFALCAKAAVEWTEEQSPYETLGVARDVDDEDIKSSYRQLAKQFHPDVYNDRIGGLEAGETPEARFIRIQAAYELLMDKDQRRQYDMDHRINPMKASKAWMDWVLKKKTAFEQRGDMAASVWAEQQQREMSLKARRLAKHKMDPEEERRILAKEKLASIKNFETTLSRHTLVLKKRELTRRKDAEEAKKKLVKQLLAAEGLELDDERF